MHIRLEFNFKLFYFFLITLLLFFPFFDLLSSNKAIVYWSGLGEFQWAKRIEYLLIQKGFEVCVLHGGPLDLTTHESEIGTKRLNSIEITEIERKFKPDIIFELNPTSASQIDCKRVLFLHHNFNLYNFLQSLPSEKYDILVVPDSIDKAVKKIWKGKIIEGYPSHANLGLNQIEKLKIFYCGFIKYDLRRGQGSQKIALMRLDQDKILDIYGGPEDWKFLKYSYRGLLPFEPLSIYEAIRKSGISLILHSDMHFSSGIPTARIFEAVAANSIIITDRHPFIVKNFGDNVLYIDRGANARSLYDQINTHFEWIKKNEQIVNEKIESCYEIFKSKYSLDTNLDEILNYLNF